MSRPASNRKAWWKCPLGHSYSAVISSRALRGSDCPYCAGSKALAGFNDLAAKAPDVAAQWHPTLNGNLTPEMVTPGSHRRVWWQCPLGHTWKAFVYSRTGRRGAAVPGLPAKAVRQIKSVLPQGGLYIDTSNIWRKVNEKTHIIPVADSLHGCDAFAHGSVC